MTYVVTENCIQFKYTDCVDVCPVDCFVEGPNFLASFLYACGVNHRLNLTVGAPWSGVTAWQQCSERFADNQLERPGTQALDCMKTQYRKDAYHVTHACGKDCPAGIGCSPLPAPPTRANVALPDCRAALPGIYRSTSDPGYGIAGLCAAGIRGLSEMRPTQVWFSACTMR